MLYFVVVQCFHAPAGNLRLLKSVDKQMLLAVEVCMTGNIGAYVRAATQPGVHERSTLSYLRLHPSHCYMRTPWEVHDPHILSQKSWRHPIFAVLSAVVDAQRLIPEVTVKQVANLEKSCGPYASIYFMPFGGSARSLLQVCYSQTPIGTCSVPCS
jgi:hypothetical protein